MEVNMNSVAVCSSHYNFTSSIQVEINKAVFYSKLFYRGNDFKNKKICCQDNGTIVTIISLKELHKNLQKYTSKENLVFLSKNKRLLAVVQKVGRAASNITFFIRNKFINDGSYGEVYSYINQENGAELVLKIAKYAESKPSMKREVLLVKELNVIKRSLKENKNGNLNIQSNLFPIKNPSNKLFYGYITKKYRCDLYDLIKDDKFQSTDSLRESFAVNFYDILNTLFHLHVNGYTHNDIKPDNIYLSEMGKVVLGDFGGCIQHSKLESEDVINLSFILTKNYSSERIVNLRSNYAQFGMQKKVFQLSKINDLCNFAITIHTTILGHYPFKINSKGYPKIKTLKQKIALMPTNLNNIISGIYNYCSINNNNCNAVQKQSPQEFYDNIVKLSQS